MKALVLLFIFFATASNAAGSGGVNAADQRHKPYLVLVSIDGFRWDYQANYDTPALDRIAAEGIRAERMIPVFPTLTFPNHYSIATGLYPANHRLIGNKFPGRDRTRFYSLAEPDTVQDGSWYGGQPVWVAAEKSGMVTAAYYFVGTEAPIDGVPMSYWHAFDASVPGNERVDQALEWLAMPDERRPHLITLYFEDVDAMSHRYGPGSTQSVAAIAQVDAYLDRLLMGIDALPIVDDVTVVVVSDHGQSNGRIDEQPFIIDNVVSLDGLTVVDHGAAAFIYFPEADRDLASGICNAINDTWEHGRAIPRNEAPKAWRASAAAGFADVIVQAEPGFSVFSSQRQAGFVSRGDHGWPPEFADMHGIFVASGPRLPKGRVISQINAVDVYPLLMEVLELPVMTAIDGDPSLLPDLLTKRR